MFTQKIEELPLFNISRINKTWQDLDMMPRRRPEWKHRCQLLLRYLQSHDLSRMPEALHQRLYVVLNEIAKVLGDSLQDKLTHQPRKWSQTDYNLEEAAKSFLFRQSIPQGFDLNSQLPSILTSSEEKIQQCVMNVALEGLSEIAPLQQQSSTGLIKQLGEKNQELAKKQKQLLEIRELYREAVIEGESFLIDEYTAKEELNKEMAMLRQEIQEQSIQLRQNEEEISKLKAMLGEKGRTKLTRIDSGLLRPDVLQRYFGRPEDNADEETLTIHSMSRPEVSKPKANKADARGRVQPSTRRPSVSVESGEPGDLTAFETQQGSEDSIRNSNTKLALLQKRLEQLEYELKTKDEVITAIHSFIEAQGESMLGQKHSLQQILRRSELKEKCKSYCSLAEENAYLKKCMDKITRSEQFWDKLREDRPDSPHDDDRKKCLIF